MSHGHITLARCWGCQLAQCYDEVTPHTWMDPDDIAHAKATGQHVPDDLVADAPCACQCSGQAGHHVPLTAEQSAAIAEAAAAHDPASGPEPGPGAPGGAGVDAGTGETGSDG